MVSVKRLKINRSQRNRAVISDVLPYELPIIFSNKGYNKWLDRYRVYMGTDGKMCSPYKYKWLQSLLSILNGDDILNSYNTSFLYKVQKKTNDVENNDTVTEKFRLNEIEEKNRLLTIPHPYFQFRVAKLYHEYSNYILYLTGRSKFSIRYPYKEGTFQSKVRDILPSSVIYSEDIDKEQDLKHYFAYKRYQNINGFYNDYKYQRAERKYRFLVRTDIKHCFDNIIPSKLFTAIYGKEEEMDNGFAKEFYDLQQAMFAGKLINDDSCSSNNQDGGILIGPEFSRIYAEIIIQCVDRELEGVLEGQSKYFGRDYEFYRYVDDGFFFSNDIHLCEQFLNIYQGILGKWGLSINNKKVKAYYSRPFLDNLTIAKRKLDQLVCDLFSNRLETPKGLVHLDSEIYDAPFQMDSKNAIKDLRSIVKEYDCDYCDLTASLLGTIHKYLGFKVLREFTDIYQIYFIANETQNIDKKGEGIFQRYEREFIEFCQELVSFLFFIFASDPRMGTSVKVSQIVLELLDYVDGRVNVEGKDTICHFSPSLRSKFFRHVSRELKSMLIFRPQTGMEDANMLLLYHRIPECFQLTENKMSELVRISGDTNFITIFTIEHLVGSKYKESKIQNDIKEWILNRLDALNDVNQAEYVYLVVNSFSCPYFDKAFKSEVCRIAGIDDADSLINNRKKYESIFIDWNSDKLLSMMRQKVNVSVY